MSSDTPTTTPTLPDPVAERDRIIELQRHTIDELMSHTHRVISITHLVLARGMSEELVSDLKSVEQRLQTAVNPEPPLADPRDYWKRQAVRLYELGYSCGAISMYLNVGYAKVHYFVRGLPGYSKFKGNRKRTRMHRKSWLTRSRLRAMSRGEPAQP